MRKGSLLKVSLKVNTECIRFTSLAILIIALLPADIKGHCPLVPKVSLCITVDSRPGLNVEIDEFNLAKSQLISASSSSWEKMSNLPEL